MPTGPAAEEAAITVPGGAADLAAIIVITMSAIAGRARGWAARLPPGYFGAVMATGILSLAAVQQHEAALSLALLLAAAGAFVLLVLLNGLRGLAAPTALLADLEHPRSVFDFFTWPAACGVLGERLAVAGRPLLAAALAIACLLLWVLVGAAALRAVAGTRWRRESLPVAGATLLAVVATQSLAVLGATFAIVRGPRGLLAAAAGWWLLGIALYVVVLRVMIRRVRSGRLRPEAVTPDYWIVMGALAISTLAGSHLVGVARGVLSGPATQAAAALTVALWAVATVLVPLLAAAEAARRRRDPASLRYEPRRWSMVFPLGMYSAATFELATVLGPHALRLLAAAFFWAGLAAWLLVAAGFAVQAAGTLSWAARRPTGTGA